MSKKDLKQEGHFERAPDMDGQFRVVTTHEYPMGWLLGKLGISPLTEKWEQGTLSELERVSSRLKSSEPFYTHPATARFAEEMAEWDKEQGRTLSAAVTEIRAELDKAREAEEFPVQELGDPII